MYEVVPHLNETEAYRIGTSMVSAGGPNDGTWTSLCGPTYTSCSFIESESLELEIDGTAFPINLELHRIRKTGIYTGKVLIGDIEVRLTDFGIREGAWVSREITLHNLSETNNHKVRIIAQIKPNLNASTVCDIFHHDGKQALQIKVPQGMGTMFNPKWKSVPSPLDRYAIIGYQEGSEITFDQETQSAKLSNLESTIHARHQKQVSLIHFMHTKQRSDSVYGEQIYSINISYELKKSIKQWNQWFEDIPESYTLNKLPAGRDRDIVEGALSYIKTNQSFDGGIVANLPHYTLSWMRDAYCGLRGLLACGHFEESRLFLVYMHHKVIVHGFVPNSSSCGDHGYVLYNGNRENNPERISGASSPCPEANTAPETPALLLLSARDYWQSNHDLSTLKQIDSTLRYCVDIQLKHAVANDYRLEFSGDETELCGAVSSEAAGYNRHLEEFWSMSSVALAAASIEFFIQYLQSIGEGTERYTSQLDGVTYNLHEELHQLSHAMERDFWTIHKDCSESGYHVWAKRKEGMQRLPGDISNLTLFPIYHRLKSTNQEQLISDVKTAKRWFDPEKQWIPLVPEIGDGGAMGHCMGYLLWSLLEINDSYAETVYRAMIDGSLAGCWGAFAEAYDADGKANYCHLRTFETGVNIDAIAKYHDLGNE